MTPDAIELPQLTERQERVLSLVVREYINKPEPVGSKYLAERFLTNVSSATIRNDMAVLEELGLIAAPHTSAGRVPTEAGYRYFVKRLLDEGELPAAEQQSISDLFSRAPHDVDQWLRLAASTLARTSRGAALVTAPRGYSSQFKHLELISTQGRLVLMVLVLYGGDVRQQMLTLADTLSQEALSATARRLNALCDGLTSEQIPAKGGESALEREVLDVIADVLAETDHKQHAVAYREGLSDVLPEFTESEAAQQVLRLMEGQSLLPAILSEVTDPHIGHVRVVIAGEGRWNEIRHLSMVLSRYGVSGQVSGTMAVLGPTRMRYGRAISAVRYVAGLMSHLLIDVYGVDNTDTP
ncbi:MAG: heat-inducible transcription repressor HrcA [Anaerolineae bacterium]|nr:heat-inducible transcription repressor HrcA [Anaerolineae bacterium]